MREYEELFRFGMKGERFTVSNSDYITHSMDVHSTKPWVLMNWFDACLEMWDLNCKCRHMRFKLNRTRVRCAKFIEREDWVVAGALEGKVVVYNYNSGDEIALLHAHEYRSSVESVAVHPTLPYVLSSSGDRFIKLWDWGNGWACTRIFHPQRFIVTHVTFNPKDTDTFASADDHGTIKVWNLRSSDPVFTLDGHENTVNCVDYYTGDDKPYLISASSDGTAKVWDYETKTCIQTLEGHKRCLTTASFHPQLPIIITGSLDGTVRYWDSITYRLDNVQHYGIPIDCIAYTKGFARVAIACRSLFIVVKLGRDIPVASMDHKSGKILRAKHKLIQKANIYHGKPNYKTKRNGWRKFIINYRRIYLLDIYPHYMKHNPDGSCVVLGGDGEYKIFIENQMESKDGYALEFVWSSDGEYALRETTFNITIFGKDFQVKTSYVPLFPAERIFGGQLLAICCSQFICFFDWENCKFIQKFDIARVKNTYWTSTGNLVAITTDISLFIFKYQHENDVFELLHDLNERVTTGLWANYNCFIYVNSSWRLNYFVGDQVSTLFYLDRPMYLLGYLAARSRVYLFDMEFNVVGWTLPLSLIKYKRLVMSGDIKIAKAIVSNIPIKHRDSAARFLESKGMLEDALNVATNTDYRFELAIQLGRLEIAKEIATSETKSESKWKRLGELSMSAGKFETAEKCLNKAMDISGLLLLYSSIGDAEGISSLATLAQQKGHNNVAFLCLFMLGRLDDCLRLLVDSNRISEASFMARSYLPANKVSKITGTWREDL